MNGVVWLVGSCNKNLEHLNVRVARMKEYMEAKEVLGCIYKKRLCHKRKLTKNYEFYEKICLLILYLIEVIISFILEL